MLLFFLYLEAVCRTLMSFVPSLLPSYTYVLVVSQHRQQASPHNATLPLRHISVHAGRLLICRCVCPSVFLFSASQIESQTSWLPSVIGQIAALVALRRWLITHSPPSLHRIHQSRQFKNKWRSANRAMLRKVTGCRLHPVTTLYRVSHLVSVTRHPFGVAYPTYLVSSKLVSSVNVCHGLLRTSCHPSMIICQLLKTLNSSWNSAKRCKLRQSFPQ